MTEAFECDACVGRGYILDEIEAPDGMGCELEVTCPKCNGTGKVVEDRGDDWEPSGD